MRKSQFVKDYLTFTRKERLGLFSLVFVIIAIILLPKLVNNDNSRSSKSDTSWIAAANKLQIKDSSSSYDGKEKMDLAQTGDVYQYDHAHQSTRHAELFTFDPNSLDEAGWERLGLKSKTIHTIQNFLNKGGHFYKPEDLKKIYGLHPEDYLTLEPYIKVTNTTLHNIDPAFVKKEYEPHSYSPKSIDVNTGDTTAFISLPGIGAKLAARIIMFRDKLGGFYSIAQIGETYGLPDSTFQKIKQYLKIENASVKKININTATLEELKSHPYIKYSLGNPIISYRNEHGAFSKIEEIKNVMAVTTEIYNKIAPYLAIQ